MRTKMDSKSSEKEIVYNRSRESVQELFGWKVLIFLPQETSWKIFLVVTVVLNNYSLINNLFYERSFTILKDLETFFGLFYLADVVLATLHYTMKNTRKLKFGKKRKICFLVIDVISLLPLRRIWYSCHFCDDGYGDSVVYYLSLLPVLRIYQIPVCFSAMRNSATTMKKYLTVNIFEIILYYLIFTHILSCFIFLCFDNNQQKKCLQHFPLCLTENGIVTFCLLSQYYLAPFSKFPLHEYKVLLIVDFFLGYTFTWTCIVPVLIFGNLKVLLNRFHAYRNSNSANVLTGTQEDKKLESKVSEYFQHLDVFGGVKTQMEVLQIFPIAMKKSICCDLHWEAMRHSVFLQDLSLGCKRSLAISMTSTFVLPNTVLFEKDKGPTYFLYLESGLLQMMAEENSSSPVLNFSGGTVFGEISFFLQKTSPVTITAAKYSVIHVLKTKDLFRVLQDYPRDRKKMFEKARKRLKFARSLMLIKNSFFKESRQEWSFAVDELMKGNVKWLKNQYRAIMELRKAEKLMNANQNNQFFFDDYQRHVRNLETNLKHTSLFINLLVVSEKTESADQVCLKDSILCAINPDCYFLSFWQRFVICTIAFTIITYPIFIGWMSHIPMWFFVISVVVSFIFQIDLALQFFTAVKTNNFMIKTFSGIFFHRVLEPFFIVDFLAAIPLQFFFYKKSEPFASNCSIAITLIKIFKLIPALKWINIKKRRFFCDIFINYLILLFVLTYWAAAVFNLTGVECVFYDCSDDSWYKRVVRRVKEANLLFIPIFKAVSLAFEVTEIGEQTNEINSFIVLLCMFCFFHFYNLQMKAGCSAALYVDLFTYIKFGSMLQFIYNFMTENNLVGNIRLRAVSMMQFQWNSEKGISNTEKQELWKLLQENLKQELNYKLKLPVIKKSRLFQDEKELFLMDLCSKAFPLFLPANSVLLTLGTQTRCLYIVEKGFVQMNSFLVKDLYLNTSRRMTATIGDAFPVIDVFSQTPTAISAVTLTDCKLLLLDLEDVLSVMTVHGMFKDLVLSLRETDLTELTAIKLAVSDFKCPLRNDDVNRVRVFQRFGCLGRVLRFLLKEKAINSTGKRYLIWELIRVVIQTTCFFLWPAAMSLLIGSPNQWILIKCILAFEMCFSLIDFYIRINLAYYNKNGIYVTHTLYTFCHYLTTSFILDLIAFTPNFHILYMIAKRTRNITLPCFIVHMLLRSVGLYRFIGYMSYFTTGKHKAPQLYFAMVVSVVLLILHLYICCIVLVLEKKIMNLTIYLITTKLVLTQWYEYYLNEAGLLLALIFRNMFFIKEYNFYTILTSLMGSTIGMLCQIALYSYLGVRFAVANENLIKYNYLIQNFVIFLEKQGAENAVLNEGVEYYEFQWQKLQGRNLKQFFTILPQTLHEDIMLPIYKGTLRNVYGLTNANDYFYRMISRNVEEIVLKEDSPVIFEKEVQSNIYFLHTGYCTVKNSTVILNKGSAIGDIKRRGIMRNKITTKSDVMLLKISSREFYRILDSFYTVKRDFEAAVKNADDFVKSVFIMQEDTLSNISSKVVEKEYLECEFVVKEDQPVSKIKKKRIKWCLNLSSDITEILKFLFLMVAYVTMIVIPFFMGTQLFCVALLSLIYVLDFLWLVKIIINLLICKTAEEKEFRQRKHIKIIRLVFKIAFQLLAVLPIEIIAFVYYEENIFEKQINCYIIKMCYINRLLRIFYIFEYFKMKRNNVVTNINLKIFQILLLEIALINLFSIVRLQFSSKEFSVQRCYSHLSSSQKEILTSSYLCTVDVLAAAALSSCLPTSIPEFVFQLVIGLWSLISKSIFINSILLLMNLKCHSKTLQMIELQSIRRFLTVRNVSPILCKKSETYYCNLQNIFHEGSEPHFLKTAPSYLRVKIMEDLCLSILLQCHLFQHLDNNFLKQLTARINITVFFPGDYIIQGGDVDHNMYLIKKGEVYCIENDTTYTALEIVTNVLGPGDTFGLPQGLFSAYPHTYTYRSKTSCSILVLNYYEWEDLRLAFPEISKYIYMQCLNSLNVSNKKEMSSKFFYSDSQPL